MAAQLLWSHLMDDRVRAQGMKPSIAEHAAIVRALTRRDPAAARAAMHRHLARVMKGYLEHTEVREMERVRQTAAEKRRWYTPVD